MSAEQKAEAVAVFGKIKLSNSIYVETWYHRAAANMQGTGIRAAFVLANSIMQGGQAALPWRAWPRRADSFRPQRPGGRLPSAAQSII
jgi:hypothetical protein